MEEIYKDFKKFRQGSNLNSESLFELLLILILWRYLSDTIQADRTTVCAWNDPGKEYYFDSIGNHHDSEGLFILDESLKKWCKINEQLANIFHIDERNLNYETIIDAWKLIKKLTSGFSPLERWTKQNSNNLFDIVSSFFLNDWKFAHEFFTPRDVSQLIAGLVGRQNEITMYDPSCGSGDLLHAALIDFPKVSRVTGVTRSAFMHRFTQIRLLLLNVPFDLYYHYEEVPSGKFDIIITNPPFGIREPIYKNTFEIGRWSKSPTNNKSETRYLTEILDRLSNKGTAVVILPNGILAEKVNSSLRKEIIEENLVEAVIHLPKGIFYQTRVSASLLLLNKQKNHTNTLFIDASKFGVNEKDRVQLPYDKIQRILYLRNSRQNADKTINIDEDAICVDLDLMRENEYDLQYSTYEAPIKYIQPRPSAEIFKECLMLESELIDIQKKIKKIII